VRITQEFNNAATTAQQRHNAGHGAMSWRFGGFLELNSLLIQGSPPSLHSILFVQQSFKPTIREKRPKTAIKMSPDATTSD
jgi:hypothetical protein